ncbi:hypothetical protein [Candidatus Protochlamydia phocaeensis]|uniref:hypothetical protein n=1 Tax=Candidatus Protochlamydia phocaeensis TaxID=1414722 RepID=UPI000AA076D6|nr:hypothetical protein [Candidatus Protochlamydia phocaeensis]
MYCWHCGASLSDPLYGKLSFREVCDKCGSSLHCCRNCKNYRPGLPNDCAVPGTDYIADREANNFCEDFTLLGQPPAPPKQNAKRSFDDLFKES